MGGVIADFSISLDGYVAGPDVGPADPMGIGGEALHAWMFGDVDPVDAAQLERIRSGIGAVVLGRRTYDLGLPYWQDVPFPAPCFVLTHAPLPPRRERSGRFVFVDAGIREALRLARDAAGGRDVRLMGALTARQYLAAGLVDEIALQVVPVLLGTGSRLFEGGAACALRRIDVTPSSRVVHLRHALVRG
jgi:dihydrofolate reductase